MSNPVRETPESLLQNLGEAIVGQRASVLLASDDAQALDACGHSLLRRLRQQPGLEISVLYDMDRELLVERFNRLLESMSIDEARRAESGRGRAQVWLLQIHADESTAQAQLLIRLAQEFPGAGVTLVVLAPDATGSALAESAGRGLRVWRLAAGPELPAGLPPATPADSDRLDEPPPSELPLAGLPAASRGGSPAAAPSARGAAAAVGRRARMLRIILALFVLTAAAVILLLASARGRAPAMAPPVGPVSAVAAVAQPADASLPPSPATKADAPGPEAQDPAGAAADKAAVTAAPPPAVVEPDAAAAPSSASPSPVSAAVAQGARWAGELDPAAWLVQHLVLDSPAAVLEWRSRHTGLAGSQIVPIRRPRTEARAYALVSGPFASTAEARGFIARPGVPTEHWVRRAAGLQRDLDRSGTGRAD